MIPREFFIEDRLEKYRLEAECNLGESGFRNFTLGDICNSLEISFDELKSISLADSPNRGREDLREEISQLYENITSEEILITTGTSEALFLFFSLVLSPNDVVRYLSPAFQALYEIPLALGAKIEPVLVKGNEIIVDELFQSPAKLVIINHPHNPTGATLSEKEILKLKQILNSWDGYVLFDEHYRFLDYEQELGFSGAGLGKKVFATGSITKSFGVTGLRIGWLVGDKTILDKARSFKDYLTHTVNPISEFLALRLLQNKKKFLKPIRETLQKNLKVFLEIVPQLPSIQSFVPPKGGLVSFLKLRQGLFSREYADALYKNTGVFVLPGADFETEGYIRVGLGETHERFVNGFYKWLKWDSKT